MTTKLQWTEMGAGDDLASMGQFLLIEAVRKVAEQISKQNDLLDALVLEHLNDFYDKAEPSGMLDGIDQTSPDITQAIDKMRTNQTVQLTPEQFAALGDKLARGGS